MPHLPSHPYHASEEAAFFAGFRLGWMGLGSAARNSAIELEAVGKGGGGTKSGDADAVHLVQLKS